MSDKIVSKVLKTFEIARKKHQYWESEWEEVARYMLPKSGGFYNANTINLPKDTSHIYDSTPRVSLRRSSASLYAYTANPVTKWFSYSLPVVKRKGGISHSDAMNTQSIKEYLETIGDIHRSYLNRAMISTQRYAFDEMIAFGVSGIYIKEEPTAEMFSAYNIPLRDLYVLTGAGNKVTFMFRKITMNPIQAAEQFGIEKLSAPVKEKLSLSADLESEDEYIHCVYKKSAYEIIPEIKGKKAMEWASVYVDKTNNHLVLEDGVPEQPFGIGRLGPVGTDVYCNSPGIDALPDVRSLNKLSAQQLETGDVAFNSPYNIPIGVYRGPLNLNPNAANYYYTDQAAGGALASPIAKYSGYSIGKDVLVDRRELVRQSMYDLVVEDTSAGNTYEAQQNQIKQLILMSPWNASLEADLFKPIIIRSFNILLRRGVLPEPPEELIKYLGNQKLEIVIDNPLSRAANFYQLTAIDRVLQVGGNLAQVGGMDKINIDATIDIYREISGAPLKMMYTDAEVKKKRAERAKKEEEMMRLQQQQAELKGAGDASKAYKNIMEAQQANGGQPTQ